MITKKFYYQAFATLMCLPLIECGQINSNQSDTRNQSTSNATPSLTIDTFSTFPPEIDGCSCYFASDSIDFKNGRFIYMNDFAKTSYLKINGVLIKFTEASRSKIDSLTTIVTLKADNYEVSIEIKDGILTGEESMLKSGTLKITDGNRRTITKSLYGECGC